MSNMIDFLLNAGDDVIDRQTAEFEIKRLSEKFGEPFVITAKSLTLMEYDGLMREGSDRTASIVVAATTDPDFGNAALRQKFTPNGRKTPLTPVEVVKKLLLPGELVTLATQILNMSGFGDNAVEKIEKN